MRNRFIHVTYWHLQRFLSFSSVKLKAVAGAASTALYFAAPEILLDMPYSMGCYELTQDNTINFDTTMSEPSPVSCLLVCQAKGSDYRFAGKKWVIHHVSLNIKVLYKCCIDYILSYTIIFLEKCIYSASRFEKLELR